MNKPRKITFAVLLSLFAVLVIAATFPLNNAFLQTDLNGNHKKITNLLELDVTTLNAINLNINNTNVGLNITNLPLVGSVPGYGRFPFANTNSGSNAAVTYDVLEAQLASQINPSFPWLIITNGSPDFVIQTDFDSLTNGGVVSFQPGTDYPRMTNSLTITNSMTVYGNGVILRYKLTGTNALMTTGTNYGKNLIIDNLGFDGDIVEPYNTVAYSNMFNGSLEPYYSQFWTNRSGLYVECSGGVRVQNCVFKNWSGNACLAMQVGGTLNAQHQPKFEFLFNRCMTNYIGLNAVCAQYETPGYNNSDSSTWLQASPEYALIQGNDIFANQFGVNASAGNILLQGNTINANWIGVSILTGINNGHGNYIGNTMNHNHMAIYTEVANGGFWSGNQMLANDELVFKATVFTTFRNNSLASTQLIFTNGTYATIIGNVYDSGDVWGSTFPTNLASTVIFAGNMDVHGSNTDGTTLSLIDTMNGLATPSNTPPTAATYKGQMFFWNSNGANVYLIKSSSGGTAWATTNLIN